jgi:hypothetical protein
MVHRMPCFGCRNFSRLVIRLVWAGFLAVGCSNPTTGGGGAGPQEGADRETEGADAGLENASDDFAAGKFTSLLRGDPSRFHARFSRLFEKRCGGETVFVGHHLGEARDAYIDAYNQRMEGGINARFGEGTLKTLLDEARGSQPQ